MNGIGGQLRGGKVIEKEAVSHVLVAGLTTGGGVESWEPCLQCACKKESVQKNNEGCCSSTNFILRMSTNFG